MHRTHESTSTYGGGRKIGSRRQLLVRSMDMRIGHKPLGRDAANHWANHPDISQVITSLVVGISNWAKAVWCGVHLSAALAIVFEHSRTSATLIVSSCTQVGHPILRTSCDPADGRLYT